MIIHIEAKEIPITKNLIGDYYNDRSFRPDFQNWLNDIWERKDKQINQIRASWQ